MTPKCSVKPQYRNRLEYAIGRTCSVDWTVKKGSRRATAVWTTWLPVAETPQTQARDVENALLSMDSGDLDGRTGPAKRLQPLIAGYGDWLGPGKKKRRRSCRRICAILPSWHCRKARRAHQRLQDG